VIDALREFIDNSNSPDEAVRTVRDTLARAKELALTDRERSKLFGLLGGTAWNKNALTKARIASFRALAQLVSDGPDASIRTPAITHLAAVVADPEHSEKVSDVLRPDDILLLRSAAEKLLTDHDLRGMAKIVLNWLGP
jgi:hypothetical protein